MRSAYWENVVDIVSTVKPEFIDKEQIKKSLDGYGRHDIDIRVLDTLYLRNILTFEEYKEQVLLLIARLELDADYHKKTTLAEIMKNGEEYDPMAHYGFNRPSFGATIDSKIEDSFNRQMNNGSNT